MQFEQHVEITPSLPGLLYTAQDLFAKGWVVDPDVPPSNIGFSYVGNFIRAIPEETEKRKPGRPVQKKD